jgi:hypothetical protein
VADAKARDRRVIGRAVGSNHTERDVVVTAPLDSPRGAHPDRVGIDEQRHHHRRVMRRATPAVIAIARVERADIHLRNRIEDEPREVILRQPLPQARRQQQLLLAITPR